MEANWIIHSSTGNEWSLHWFLLRDSAGLDSLVYSKDLSTV